MKQQFELWQLSLQTSITCWQSMSLRYALFASKTPLDAQIINESLKIVGEKVSLSIELAQNVASQHPVDDSFGAYRKILKTINQKASANVDRLTSVRDNA